MVKFPDTDRGRYANPLSHSDTVVLKKDIKKIRSLPVLVAFVSLKNVHRDWSDKWLPCIINLKRESEREREREREI